MFVAKNLIDYTNLFSPDNYKKNDKTIYKHFNDKYDKPGTYLKILLFLFLLTVVGLQYLGLLQ